MPARKTKEETVQVVDVAVNTTPEDIMEITQDVDTTPKDIVKNKEKDSTEALLDQISTSVSSVASSDVVASKARKQEQSVPLDEEIPCMSVTFGGLTWISPKTNAHYRWNDIGDVEYIPFGELITLNNTKRDYLFNPLFVVQDSRAVKYFRLTETYEKVAQIHNLSEVFNQDLPSISKTIDTALRVNMRDVMISKVREMRRNGSLTNIDIIKLLERKLGFDISEDDQAETE